MTDGESAESLARLCAFPEAVRSTSVREAAKGTGFEALRATLNVRELAEYLRSHPSVIADWLAYSQDKRTGEGWYFRAPTSVGRIVHRPPPTRELRFVDPAAACAAFIVGELAWILDDGGAT